MKLPWPCYLQHLLFFSFFLHFQQHCSSSLAKSCHPNERSALLKFKDSLIIEDDDSYYSFCDKAHPLNKTWVEATDCCSWDGITCDRLTGHVIGMDLSCHALYGTITPTSTLFLLPHLQKLNLAWSRLSGSISSGFGLFANLTHLNLSSCLFSGQIPPEISRLSKLVSLDLSFNSDSDKILKFHNHGFEKLSRNLTKLIVLDLRYVDMSLVAPKSLLNLSSSLKSLHLSNCFLQGNLPGDFLHFQSLEILDISSNFDLVINISEAKLSASLRFLDIHEMSSSGELSDSIINLLSLEYLDLSFNRFFGSIPASLGNLESVKHFDFSNNNFFGSIPATVGNLMSLEYLDLSFNNFFSLIPTSLGDLKSLKYLDFSFTNFSGSMPAALVNLESLKYLDVSFANFSGSIPAAFGNLKSLEYLDLSFNNFSGCIPPSLGKIKKLKFLALKSNQFSGQIPDIFAKPSKSDLLNPSSSNFSGQLQFSLLDVDLSDNELHGPIPSSIFELVNLKSLFLSSNNLSGIIEWNMFQKLKNLVQLDLSWNSELSLRSSSNVNFTLPYLFSLALSSCNITKFPHFLKTLENLSYLDLSHNRIYGKITKQKSIGWESLSTLSLSHNFLTGIEQYPWSNIRTLDLSFNFLKGPLPVPPNSTEIFLISNNQLSGEIPSLVCNLSSLVALDLANNDFEGLLPKCLEDIAKFLFILNLQGNNFFGRIPEIFAHDSSLVYLNANGNKFEGPLPRSLANCRRLQILDLGNNKLNDTFPHWLQHLLDLQILILRSNSFHGTIGNPITKSPFPKLQILDLSHNELTGLLPTKYLRHLKYLMKVNEDKAGSKYAGDSAYYFQDSLAVDLIMKGVELEMNEILTIFTAIDFSNNRFQGHIPEEVGMLKSLVVLNFSHNYLTGHIPSSLANLTEVESLDLSENRLVGEIPQQLTVLTFLAVLNLSYNQLNGTIPQGNQFNTFSNDSYIGNIGLCGFPLSKKCNNGEAPQLPSPRFQEEGDSTDCWYDWKIALMGYGCGLVFGLSMGYIIFATGKPQWFVRMVEGKQYKRVRRPKKFRGIGRRT
ncbi:hypothetical protein P3X46_006943 [Hevea brasiliensis]|uniref:Leucine-rich repeat-containing N-terminal plant-type domain-containing protein n=1 Tax=Hevea brasiliensis TaxID=3981 RepID=A0ABQ9MVM8_HEVBR|nr:receptor-like protein 6 [Hevea brasiliensis]KAJ9183023.1 hypothetical protein P3X46_006943 [Hevea brasiliensis]